ncbi:hypothetical protein UlMin_012971 [Ulmus minor]
MAKFAGNSKAVLVVVLVCLLVVAPGAEAAVTCEQVTNWLTPCISYGVFGGTVLPACCEGIKELNNSYQTKEDIRESCSCIQDGAARIPGIDYDRINQIPGLCGTTCPFKVYPSTDCSKVV